VTTVLPPGRVIALLCLVSFVAYLLRTNITIAQEAMAPALGLSMVQMGVISAWGFQLFYALGQVPAGVYSDRVGARTMLLLAIVGWTVASVASGSVGGATSAAFWALFLSRVLLGVSQAITFPAVAMIAARDIPDNKRVGASAMYFAASSLGSALAPLLLAPLMTGFGWRAVFFGSAAIGVLTALLWITTAPRDAPHAGRQAASLSAQQRAVGELFRVPALRWLSLSYLLHSAVYFVFVFWFVRYLTDARGFSILATGVWASVPHFMATAIAPLAGRLIDRLGPRLGVAVARRRAAIVGLVAGAVLTLVGTRLPTPTLAVLALGLAASCLLSLEAPYWTTATDLAPHATGAAGGMLNLMGNIGGVFSIWLVPVMTEQWGWTATLSIWAAVAVGAAALWSQVRVATAPPPAWEPPSARPRAP
jgi:MFS transporter, ACS family, glucarate transporter